MTDETVSAAEGSGDFVQSLARGLAIIRTFDGEHPALTLSDVARRADVPRAAARRFLHTLEALGYVRADGRSFSLTPRVLELGFSYLSSMSLPEIVQPHLERLSHQVGESVSAAVLDGADIIYVARVPTRRIMSVRITIGTRFPAYATSMGRVLLAALAPDDAQAVLTSAPLEPLTPRTRTDAAELRAELDVVRERGWALIDGELEPGVRSVAAPVHGRDGEVVAAVNISTSATRDSVERIEDVYVPILLATTSAIDGDMRLV
ncbi:IclR family transcriptional regulator domain-containing protein [Microbacterium sp. RD1]|uniref:IclR family transcriptional regulator domain-containing protein n=1 Tax=Microbacterium sp. RD1 TaxID=3457313 RepID=UPI003FA5E56A